ncbi:hypothetical protein SynSYN20_01841 [Synechococcus sp. SYN20]|nr:hypothetical protein SynSYN20_01841 [Synechococcus sp. SYN20]
MKNNEIIRNTIKYGKTTAVMTLNTYASALNALNQSYL